MTSSPLKLRANKANAQRSTGPKTAAGRRRASQNARAHGLSVPQNLQAMEAKVQQIASLVEAEGSTLAQARELAVKIMDYERNLQHEREAYARNFLDTELGWQDPQSLARTERQRYFRDRLENPLYTSTRTLNQDQRDQYRATVRGIMFLVRLHARWEQGAAQMALRYYKRAGNQLTKALRALT
jgi:hypothetical protein